MGSSDNQTRGLFVVSASLPRRHLRQVSQLLLGFSFLVEDLQRQNGVLDADVGSATFCN